MNTIIRLRITVLFVMICCGGYAQQISNNTNVWFHYVGKNRLSEKVSVTLETSLRYTNGFSQKQQWFVRPSLDYQFSKSFTGSVGYTYYDTYVYGEFPINKVTTPEHHFWVQGTLAHALKDWKFTHRLRDENRYVGIAQANETGNLEITSYAYRNRLRYMFSVNHPVFKKEGKTALFAVLGDEVFVNVGVKDAETLLQQNRVIAGFGYYLNTHHQIQLNYIHQNIWNLKNTIEEHNPTIRISYLTNLDWFKKQNN